MSQHFVRSRLTVISWAMLTAAVLGIGSIPAALSQDAPPKAAATKAEAATDPDGLKQLIERIRKLESEVDRLKKGGPAAADGEPQSVMAMLDIAHLGFAYTQQGQTRYLALHLILANPTKQSFVISRDQVIAEIDGEERKLNDLPQPLLNQSFQANRQQFQVATMKPPKEWRLPAGGQTGLWLVYPDVTAGPNVPKCRLKLKLGDATKELNVNELQRAQLNLEIERIGPRESLALVTIGGSLNNFNAGSLVEELDKLVEQKLARVVLRWIDGASPPDPQIMNWLQTATSNNAGNQNQNPMFPSIPSAIREFHLTEFPASDDPQGRSMGNFIRPNNNQLRVHKTSAEAVGSALRTAYLALPRDELLKEIREGNPLSRSAALAYGGGRLDVANLPQIFEWVEDQDPELQRAALQSLSHFGEPQAVEKLVLYARRNTEPLSSTAIESLAGSRFGTAHDALLTLLKNEPAETRKKMVQVLAKYPRPIWSETLYEFVTNSPAGMDLESLKALVQVGHPQLVDLLERALKSTDKSIRDQAFQTLAQRNDPQSEALSIEFALKSLESPPLDGITTQVLSRAKDPRAIPILLKQFESNNDRVAVINLLTQMGDQSVADKMVLKYGMLNNPEKVQVLQALRQFRHPKFRPLCGEALLTSDNQLVTAAAQHLAQEASPEGEQLLIAAMENQKMPQLMINILNSLASFGSPSARSAIIKIRDSGGDPNKKLYAKQALLQLRQRSPGFQYFAQGDALSKRLQDKEAMEAFDLAIQFDADFPDPYLGRGQLFLKLEKFAAARKDFEKVLELQHEPESPGEFATSLAIARIGDGQVIEGLKYLEDHRAENKKSVKGLFFYNAACAYSRAIEQVEGKPDLPDRDKLRETYRNQAIADLKESVAQGFEDYTWMAKDPDLKPLHGEADFKKILADKPTKNLPENQTLKPEEQE